MSKYKNDKIMISNDTRLTEEQKKIQINTLDYNYSRDLRFNDEEKNRNLARIQIEKPNELFSLKLDKDNKIREVSSRAKKLHEEKERAEKLRDSSTKLKPEYWDGDRLDYERMS